MGGGGLCNNSLCIFTCMRNVAGPCDVYYPVEISDGPRSALLPHPGVQLYLSWLCYFYLALSLRENVLMVNGSHIKGWWIQVGSAPSPRQSVLPVFDQISAYSPVPFPVPTAPLLELSLLAADVGPAGVQPR